MNSLKLSPSSRAYQDFLEAFDGLSYRHAFELLAHGGKAAYERPPDAPRKQTTVPRLPCPLDETAEDVILLDQVAAYYASRLAAPESQSARDYLVSRGLDDETLWQRFGIGFSDRTLGLRIPEKNRKQGAELRNRLQAVGVYRPTGREHLNGCITIPIRECGHHSQTSGHVAQIYGRRTEPKAPSETRNLYLARPLAGTFNPAALTSREIILTESILDALTFIRHGSEAGLPLMEATTCLYGSGGLTDEFFEAIRTANIQSVRLAFGSGEAGDFAAAQTAARFKAIGIECHRIRFPRGMNANAFALERGGEALRQTVRSAEWLGGHGSGASPHRAWASPPTRNPQIQTTPVVAPPTVATNTNHQVTAAPENAAQPIANLTPQGDASNSCYPWFSFLNQRLRIR